MAEVNYAPNPSSGTTTQSRAYDCDCPASAAAGGGAGGGAPTTPSYLTLATNPTLTNERVLVGTANQIVLTDGGAGGNLTLSLPQDVATTSTPTFGPLTINGVANTSAITINGATHTASAPLINATQIWNNAGVTFTALKVNVTDTASAGSSLLIDLQMASTSQFSVGKAGLTTLRDLSVTASSLQMSAAMFLFWAGRSSLTSPSNGVVTVANNTGTDFTRLQLGGTTNLFPSIKRSSATLAFRLADDSADCDISCAKLTTSSTTLHTSSVALTDGAAAQVGTLTNAPTAGNPTKWIPIVDNGTTRFVPAW